MANSYDRYRVDTTDPAIRLEERIRQLERQVSDLSAARNLRRSSMRGGLVRWLDEAGTEVVGLGAQGFAGYAGTRSGRGGLRVVSQDGDLMFLATAEDGLVWPPLQATFGRLNDGIAVSTGTFTPVWQCYTALTARTVNTIATFTAPAGTTGEARLVIGGTGFVTDARPIAAGIQTDVTFSWDLESTGLAVGTSVFINVEARLTAGAGPLFSYLPRPARMSDRTVFGGTSSGVPVPP